MNQKLKIIKLLAGLPGSGISDYGRTLAQTKFCFLDNADLHKENSHLSLTQFSSYENLAISSPKFYLQEELDFAIELIKKTFKNPIDIEIVFFENNPEKSIKNLNFKNKREQEKDNKKDFSYIYEMSQKYIIPVNINYEYIKILEDEVYDKKSTQKNKP